MRVLITGGAGFIGSHIQDKLIDLGHDVAVLDNLSSGKKEHLHPKSTFFEADVRSAQKVLETFTKFQPEAVFHLAAQIVVPYSMAHPYEDMEINIGGTINVLEAARQTGIRKYVHTNTGGAYYGEVSESEMPVPETKLVTTPTSAYGVSKAAAEQYVRLYGFAHGLSWVSLRYANVYGPRQDGSKESGVVAIFTSKLLARESPTIFGDGSQTRNYVYVGDVADANILALDYPGNDAFNIAVEVNTSTQQVYDTIEAELKTGLKVQYAPERPGDVGHSSISIVKAKELLGWTPKVDFAAGIHHTIAHYQKLSKSPLSQSL